MDAIVLRALEKANQCLQFFAHYRDDVFCTSDMEAAYWDGKYRKEQRRISKFHDYLVRKLDEGKDAQAEVKRLEKALDEIKTAMWQNLADA